MISVNPSSFGRFTGAVRRYLGGTENPGGPVAGYAAAIRSQRKYQLRAALETRDLDPEISACAIFYDPFERGRTGSLPQG